MIQQELVISTYGKGLYEITDAVAAQLNLQEISVGLLHLFVRHTSCSLTIQENADPTAKRDLENWMDRLVKEDDPLFTHTIEGKDDMPAHIKAVLTCTTLTIPIHNHSLALGTWQGIYLWEHRVQPHQRKIILSVID